MTATPVKYVDHNLTTLLQQRGVLSIVEMVKNSLLNVMMAIIKMVMAVV